jgi:hypothetical protein
VYTRLASYKVIPVTCASCTRSDPDYMQIWCKRGSFWPMLLSLGNKSTEGSETYNQGKIPTSHSISIAVQTKTAVNGKK